MIGRGIEMGQQWWWGMMVLLIILCCPLVRAWPQHKQPPAETEGQETIQLRSDLVSFPVTVALQDGKPLTALGPENFIVYENNVPQKVTHFAAVETPVDIVVMVDDSGSMRDHLGLIRRAARRFVDQMRRQDRGAIIAFGRRVELLADLTHERGILRQAVGRIPSGAGTAFYDALYLVAQEMLQAAAARKAVIVLSDGVDSSSYYEFEKVSRVLERTGVTAYFIEVDTEADMLRGLMKGDFILSASQLEKYRQVFRPTEPPFRYRNPSFFTGREKAEIARGLYQLARKELQQMADRTGGRVFRLGSFSHLRSIYEQIGAELGTLFSIGYYPTNSTRDGVWRAIRVEVNIPGARVHARSGYWAPSK